jgi:hypothetical protein
VISWAPQAFQTVLVEIIPPDIRECADLQQSVPIGGVARQPGYFQTEHDASSLQPDFRNEPLEPSRSTADAPDCPRSLSITMIRSCGQPKAMAFC